MLHNQVFPKGFYQQHATQPGLHKGFYQQYATQPGLPKGFSVQLLQNGSYHTVDTTHKSLSTPKLPAF